MPYIKRNKTKKQTYKRGLRQKYYNLMQWRNLRKWYAMNHPICEVCGAAASQHIHHVVSPFSNDISEVERLQRLLQISNLKAVCVDCHLKAHGLKK